MAFAIFYDLPDMTAMSEAFQDASISGKDRNDGRTFWNNGLSGWATAPIAPVEHPEAADPLPPRILVVQNTTLQSFRQYLYDMYVKYPACVFFGALADDLTHRLAVVEPWPWVGPPSDPWIDYR